MASGFSVGERKAMKERAAELRAEGKKGAKKADGLEALLEAIEKMDDTDRPLAERFHATVTAAAPSLDPRTWYGMPAYSDADGKTVLWFKNAGKFKQRYATFGFEDPAALDDGETWPVVFALTSWTPAVEKQVTELVTKAVS